jgi:hypothetical protein
VASKVFHMVRRQVGVKGRPRKRSPEDLMLTVFDGEEGSYEERGPKRKVPVEDHPSYIFLPRLLPPKKFPGRIFPQLIVDGIGAFDIWDLTPDPRDERLRRLKKRGIAKPMLYEEMGISPILQLLAKIAHCAAVATFGLTGFEHQLPPIISGQMEGAMDLIGSMPADAQNVLPFAYPAGLHEAGVGVIPLEGMQHALVQIRLFSGLVRGSRFWPDPLILHHLMPTHAVLAGRLLHKSDQ